MSLGLALLVVVAAGIAWYWKSHPKPILQKRVNRSAITTKTAATATVKNALAQKTAIKETLSHKYHSVSIQSKDDACAAVKQIADQRFLTHAAPAIPLQSCDAANCHCNYVHYSDRREDDEDRRSMYSMQTELYKQTAERDRREQKGRRNDDTDC